MLFLSNRPKLKLEISFDVGCFRSNKTIFETVFIFDRKMIIERVCLVKTIAMSRIIDSRKLQKFGILPVVISSDSKGNWSGLRRTIL